MDARFSKLEKRARQARERAVEARATMLSFTNPHQKWPLYDAKIALQRAEKDYEAALAAKYGARPAPPLGASAAMHWEDILSPAIDELARVRRNKHTPFVELTDALYAWAVADLDYEIIQARHKNKYVDGHDGKLSAKIKHKGEDVDVAVVFTHPRRTPRSRPV